MPSLCRTKSPKNITRKQEQYCPFQKENKNPYLNSDIPCWLALALLCLIFTVFLFFGCPKAARLSQSVGRARDSAVVDLVVGVLADAVAALAAGCDAREVPRLGAGEVHTRVRIDTADTGGARSARYCIGRPCALPRQG